VAGSLGRLPTHPSNRARQKARQPASPRPRTRSSNPVPSSGESVANSVIAKAGPRLLSAAGTSGFAIRMLRRILTTCGPVAPPSTPTGNLAAAGFASEDIDYVLCTHLHADHVGWNTRLLDGRWVPTFPNARYLFARQEWEHWRVAEWRAAYTTDPYYEDSLLPIMESGQAELVATDYAFDHSVWIEPWAAHTPGHVCVVVGSPQSSVVLSGDLMHTPLQCAEPQLNSCFCVDAEVARDTAAVHRDLCR
jgi:metallo-beta-lactamase superfamily protein